MELMKESIEAIIDNIHEAEEYLVAEDIDDFLDIIVSANNVFVTGAGRSGLAAKAFAMRLMHLGLSAYVVGETISPAIYEGDCILAISGSGETNTITSAAKISKNRGAKVLASHHSLKAHLENSQMHWLLSKEGQRWKLMMRIILKGRLKVIIPLLHHLEQLLS